MRIMRQGDLCRRRSPAVVEWGMKRQRAGGGSLTTAQKPPRSFTALTKSWKALKTNRVLNEVAVTRDGAETLDYLWRRNAYAGRHGWRSARATPGARTAEPARNFMSGYADPSVEEALPDGCDLMEKPFTAHTLLSRVRESLGSRVVIRTS
jgi:hypothetical protein